MLKLFVSFLLLVFSSLSIAQTCPASGLGQWQTFPSVSPSTTGASYTISIPFVPLSVCSSYTILVSDMQLNNFSNGYSWTSTSAVQVKDSNGNNVCSAATSSSNTATNSIGGSSVTYHWQQICSSGTLTNGNTYTVNITGNAYYWGAQVTKPPQLAGFISAN